MAQIIARASSTQSFTPGVTTTVRLDVSPDTRDLTIDTGGVAWELQVGRNAVDGAATFDAGTFQVIGAADRFFVVRVGKGRSGVSKILIRDPSGAATFNVIAETS